VTCILGLAIVLLAGCGGDVTPRDDAASSAVTQVPMTPADNDMTLPACCVPECGRPGDCKVTICHVPPGNPDNAHTITIGEAAVRAHLAHGDKCGQCGAGACIPQGGSCSQNSGIGSDACNPAACCPGLGCRVVDNTCQGLG
jgi:hypothetical protein